MLKKSKNKWRHSSSFHINNRSRSQHYTDVAGWKHWEHWHLHKIPVPAVSHKCTQIPQTCRVQGAVPVHTIQDPKYGNSQWMGQGLTPAGRASITCTRAKENSVFANHGQLISLSAPGPGLALFLLQTAGSSVKAGSLFWSFCKKATAQSLGTMTWTKTHPNQSLSTGFNEFWTKLKNQENVRAHRGVHQVDMIWEHEVAQPESLL